MKLKIKADDSNLEIINDFIHNLLPANCDLKILNEIDLAVEEIFVNIAHYAYKDLLTQQKNAAASSTDSNLGFAEIFVDFDSASSILTVELCDWGVPFDPLKKEDPDITLSAEERKIGGLGIFLTKKFMNSVSYKHENGQNKLKITKKI